MLSPSRRRCPGPIRSENGFSLVEMLVVIAIIGVVSIPLTNVVVGLLRNTAGTSHRLAESHDAQLSAAYWAQDVADLGTRSTADPLAPVLLQSVETNIAFNAGTYRCGNDKALVRLASDNVVAASSGNATTTLVVVAYVLKPMGGARYALHRVRCVGSTTPVSDVTVAKNLLGSPETPNTPQVLCDGTTVCDGSGPSVPKRMELRLRIQDPASTSSYDVTLSGQRRQE